jgi:hypothetical protein
VYPDPDKEVDAPGTGGRTKNKDLGAWQSYMACVTVGRVSTARLLGMCGNHG